MKYKVLTIRQPWAALIMSGIKNIENRTWQTKYRGRILIHTSKLPNKQFKPDDVEYLSNEYGNTNFKFFSDLSEIYGAIIGSVFLCGILHPSSVMITKWQEKGYWGWQLRDQEILKKSIPAKGKLGLWEYDSEDQRLKMG